MNGVTPNSATEARGFSVVEILIALSITMVVMASVFMLLKKGQDSFERAPESHRHDGERARQSHACLTTA